MKKKFILILMITLLFLFNFTNSANEKNTLDEVKKLNAQKKYQQIVELVNKALLKNGTSIKLHNAKTAALLDLKQYDEALQSGIRSYELNPRKSPWRCMEIVSICIKLKDNEKAFEWLDKAVEQGLLTYSVLYEKEYEPLRKDNRFDPIIERIKAAIGIGKPAKDFVTTLISGEKISLSGLKGKVVLIDFWATWCPPCVKGVPHLKELYKKYRGKKFEIIGISLDNKEELVNKFIAKEKIEWKMIYSGKAWADDIARHYKVNLIPSYWIIDKEGILRDFGIHLRDKHKLAGAVEKLL